MFDCIIVGAGPAGGSAAYHLAKKGHSVLLVERAALPRYKPCSGGVSPVVAQWFDFDFSPIISCTVDQVRYTWQRKDPIEAQLTTAEPMWMVERDKFDYFLVQQAQSKGAEIRDRTEVVGISFSTDHWQVTTSNGVLEGKYLIAADGAKGPMAKWLGFTLPDPTGAEVLEIKGTSSSTAHFDVGLVKSGNLWAFPKADGYSISACAFRGKTPSDYHKPLADYAAFLGLGQGEFHQHPIAFWQEQRPLHTQNALLAGEAAALVDPLSGEGIRPAMFSGVKAAEAIDAALAGNSSALAGYTEILNREWGSNLDTAKKISGLFYKVPGIAYKVGLKRPAATKRMGQVLTGETSYAELSQKIAARLNKIPGVKL